ncbi:MAG: ATP-binding cassette domain-containing protein [Gammaproteobacteria bacterium]
MSVLSFSDVTLFVNDRALFEPLNFEIPGGTTRCLLGPSGSGKSSLLAFACGFLPPDIRASGQLRLDATDLTHMPAQNRQLGLLFQDGVLFPHLSVAGNVLFGLRDSGSKAERRVLVDEALGSVGLEGFAERDPASLSGGQKARVALLRVLLARPRALLLDEPFSALDPATRSSVRELVFTKARESGLPTLLVTHDQEDVAAAGGVVTQLTPPGQR